MAYATLPSNTPLTIDLKLSSITIILAVSRAISVPLPIAIPTLAARKAGASLTPSPVTATNSPCLFKDSTIFNFSNGVTLVNIFLLFTNSSNSSSGPFKYFSTSSPVVTSSKSLVNFKSLAILKAVSG